LGAPRSGVPGGEQLEATTSVPAVIQVAAMDDTFLVIGGLVCIALAVAVWAWVQERETIIASRPNSQAPVATD
jgi:hypothetical protein